MSKLKKAIEIARSMNKEFDSKYKQHVAQHRAIQIQEEIRQKIVKKGEAFDEVMKPILSEAGISLTPDEVLESPQYTIDTIISKLKAVSALEPLSAELDALAASFKLLNEKHASLAQELIEFEDRYANDVKLMDQLNDELQECLDSQSFLET